MRRLALGLCLLAGLLAVAPMVANAAGFYRFWQISTGAGSPFTGAAPTADCDLTEASTKASPAATGLHIKDCLSYQVCVAAAAGQTLSGAGSLEAYEWDEAESEQMRSRGADETLDSEASGERELCFPVRVNPSGNIGCAYWNPVGVTTSGGTALRTFARCFR